MSEIPHIEVLKTINPANSGTGEGCLGYTALAATIEKYRSTNLARTAAFWDSEPGSLDELAQARELAGEYLLRTAGKEIASHEGNHDLWADRFTQASIELYGAPDAREAAKLILTEYTKLADLVGQEGISQRHVEFLLSMYEPLVASTPHSETLDPDTAVERKAVQWYGETIWDRYRPILSVVGKDGQATFNAHELQGLFSTALDWLQKEDDKEWAKWAVVNSQGTSLSVGSVSRKIKIASRRETASMQEARGLLAHELLVHAMRSKNGHKAGDRQLATGLAGYLNAEEGLGIVTEEAVNGTLPERANDRYVDIALALGQLDGVQRTRAQIFQLSLARQIVRAEVHHTYDEAELPSLERRAWAHADRMYKGGRGDEVGVRQAIFTKDVAYYAGYKYMAAYIARQKEEGKSAAEVFSYISQAKFDPGNLQHTQRLAAATNSEREIGI